VSRTGVIDTPQASKLRSSIEGASKRLKLSIAHLASARDMLATYELELMQREPASEATATALGEAKKALARVKTLLERLSK
jgi:hypothetical protein